MIKFFRHIRQQLLSENKFRRYLIYAIGEIVLVVIGILIALQLNEWNGNRLDRLEERKLLNQLTTEFTQNNEQLLSKIALRQRALESTQHLLEMIDNRKTVAPTPKIDSLLAYAIPAYTFDPLQGVMSQLIQAGKLTLITNDSIREMLSNWNGVVDDLKESEVSYSDFNRNDFRTFLYKYANYRDIINERIKYGVISETLIDQDFLYTTELGPSTHESGNQFLLNSKEFENFLASGISHISYLNTQSYGLHTYIEKLIHLMEKELAP